MGDVNFENKTVVVTGAGNGQEGICLEFANRGANVVVNDIGGSVNGEGSENAPADIVVRIIDNGGSAVANYDSVATKSGGESIIQSALSELWDPCSCKQCKILQTKVLQKWKKKTLMQLLMSI